MKLIPVSVSLQNGCSGCTLLSALWRGERGVGNGQLTTAFRLNCQSHTHS